MVDSSWPTKRCHKGARRRACSTTTEIDPTRHTATIEPTITRRAVFAPMGSAATARPMLTRNAVSRSKDEKLGVVTASGVRIHPSSASRARGDRWTTDARTREVASSVCLGKTICRFSRSPVQSGCIPTGMTTVRRFPSATTENGARAMRSPTCHWTTPRCSWIAVSVMAMRTSSASRQVGALTRLKGCARSISAALSRAGEMTTKASDDNHSNTTSTAAASRSQRNGKNPPPLPTASASQSADRCC